MRKIITLCIVALSSGMIYGQSEDLPVSYSIGMNAWIGSENDSDKGLPAEGLVSDGSYHFQLTYKFPTKKPRSSWVPFAKSVQQFVSVRALKFRSNTGDGDGYEWVESLEALGFVYGQRYFIRDDYQGFNIGWYLGMAQMKTNGYEWLAADPDPTPEVYKENFIAPLWAIELNYHLELGPVYIEPTYSFYVNTSARTFEGFPSIIVGLQINQ